MFTAANLPLSAQAWQAVFKELRNIQKTVPAGDFGVIRLENADWVTSTEQPVIHLGIARQFARKLIAAAATNYLAIWQLESASDGNADTSDQIKFVMYVFVWGEEIRERAEAAVSSFHGRLRPLNSASEAIKLEWLQLGRRPLRDALAPCWKTTSIVTETRDKAGTGERGSPTAATCLRYLRLYSFWDIKKTVMAGGQGKSLRNAIMKKLAAWLKSQRTGPIVLHPEGLVQFWMELMAVLGGNQFKMPIVTYAPLPARRKPARRRRVNPRTHTRGKVKISTRGTRVRGQDLCNIHNKPNPSDRWWD